MNAGILLKATLLLVGAAIMMLGLNIGLGGIRTLGWQMPGEFFEITDEALFRRHDSHIRFIGGVWFGIGVTYFAGGIFLDELRSTLVVLCAAVALAGLFRLSGATFEVGPNAAVWPSFALEVLGFPSLGWWLSRPFVPHEN